jgi:hypothetical protein
MSSCGGSKSITGTVGKNMAIKDIIASHNLGEPKFNTLAARVQVVYEDEKKLQSITASLRMEKDKIIWIRASILGITLSKILITPDRVSYYESITNTYFEGDFTLLSDVLGTEVDFQKVQDILLGQSIFSLNSSEYSAISVQNKIKLSPNRQQLNFIHFIMLNADNFKVNSETLSQPDDERLLSVRYGDYQEIDGSLYPSEILIEATEKEEKTKIEVNYKKIDLNVPLSFPFSIPSGYEEIQLK